MNIAVGILQAEEVGAIKKTLVGKSYSIKVGRKFEIRVGESKIMMTPDSISITAKTILVAAKKDIDDLKASGWTCQIWNNTRYLISRWLYFKHVKA